MKKFAVKCYAEGGCTYTFVVDASNAKNAIKVAGDKYNKKFNLTDLEITVIKVKEIPSCYIKSCFGYIPVKVEPNPYYADEIIINSERVHLPDRFNYWDINSIIIHNINAPTIATITTNKDRFVVQNNNTYMGKYFEILK